MCEYCSGTQCDGIVYWEDLDYDYEEIFLDNNKQNNKKRKFMYTSHIFTRHGRLGVGRKNKLQECVCKYITKMFPVSAGMNLMGHYKAQTGVYQNDTTKQ